MAVTRIAIVDDEHMVGEGIAMVLSRFDDLELVQRFQHGNDLLACLDRGTAVDVLLLDVRMRDMDGIVVLSEVRKRHPQVRVLFVTSVEDPVMLAQGLKLGASGWINKHASPDELHRAIVTVGKGAEWLPRKDLSAVTAFTPRELEIIRALAAGHDNSTIAEELSLSVGTVKNYVSLIYEKLDVSHRGEAIARIRAMGLEA
jgi:DNA-binding NarL/FixJ family response regulator